MKWISVEDQTPPQQKELWVTDGHRCAEAYCWLEGDIESAYDSFDTMQGMKEITHWMKLPEPPKK